MPGDPKMAKILRFRKDHPFDPGGLNTAKIWEYVLPRLGFPLPDFITREIDGIVSDIWNRAELEISFYDCVEALDSLKGKDILIPVTRREKIVELMFEFLERKGYLITDD
jgi:hypothetical protein